jgi:hypothetical protein
MSEWLFADPQNVAVLTTCQILEGAAILYVSHDEDDGAWQFHSGEIIDDADARLVSLRKIVELDNSVALLADLPLGSIATRPNTDAVWLRSPNQ